MDYLLPFSCDGNPDLGEKSVSTGVRARWNEERVEIFMLLLQHEMLMRLQLTQEELKNPHHETYLTSKVIAKRLDLELFEVVEHMRFLRFNSFVRFYSRRDIDVFCDIPSVRALGYGKTSNVPTFGFVDPALKTFLTGVPKETIREEVTWLIDNNLMYDFRLDENWNQLEKHPKAT